MFWLTDVISLQLLVIQQEVVAQDTTLYSLFSHLDGMHESIKAREVQLQISMLNEK